MKISYVVNKMNDFCFVNVAYLKIHIFLYVDKLSHWPDSNLYVHLSRLLTFELSTLYLQFFKNPSGSLSFLPLICYQCAYLMGFHMGWVWICHQQESYCTNLVGTPFLLAIKVSSGYSWTLCYLTPIPAHWIEIATLTFFQAEPSLFFIVKPTTWWTWIQQSLFANKCHKYVFVNNADEES